MIWMTIMGILSGILSSFKLGVLGDIIITEVPIQQGLLFGTVIAVGIYRWGQSGWAGALLALLTVMIAWIAAYTGFRILTGYGFNSFSAGLIAGAIGASGTILAGAITVQTLRRPVVLVTTISLGAILGLLAIFAMGGEDKYLLILFIPWQAVIAASIGHAMANKHPATAMQQQ